MGGLNSPNFRRRASAIKPTAGCQRLLPTSNKERENHATRKEMLQHIVNHYAEGMDILENIFQILGKDEVMYDKPENMGARDCKILECVWV